ncbi:hypothetical protein DS745_13290 [Anaerobacillus alkaliphilus]|uniref:Uncharacterized protein n=1 Tax=Anaerobacillus alkaliphilus TaxID=1548597 RepID=A0A4Q0VRH2_9BACI|nr:DUF6069 family protein [Anaerobacillus alkaliphilus]RXI99850.1 hypothetical protein DS745_13290 [Anaerobacillus alkaliphilus]
MYKNKFTSYLKTGLFAASITALVAVVSFLLSSYLFNFPVEIIGESRDTLYLVLIAGVSFIAVFISSIIFYFLQRFTRKPLVYFILIVILGLIGNAVLAENDLLQQYKMTAHIIHLIVAGLAILLVPQFSRKKQS